MHIIAFRELFIKIWEESEEVYYYIRIPAVVISYVTDFCVVLSGKTARKVETVISDPILKCHSYTFRAVYTGLPEMYLRLEITGYYLVCKPL